MIWISTRQSICSEIHQFFLILGEQTNSPIHQNETGCNCTFLQINCIEKHTVLVRPKITAACRVVAVAPAAAFIFLKTSNMILGRENFG